MDQLKMRREDRDSASIYSFVEGQVSRVEEPAVCMEQSVSADVPEYVWEDVHIGMQQYQQGMCISINEFLKKYECSL